MLAITHCLMVVVVLVIMLTVQDVSLAGESAFFEVT
jgi:hypothetical protein